MPQNTGTLIVNVVGNGNVVPRAQVIIKPSGNAPATMTGETDLEGNFRAELNSGTYDVICSAESIGKSSRSDVAVHADDELHVKITLNNSYGNARFSLGLAAGNATPVEGEVVTFKTGLERNGNRVLETDDFDFRWSIDPPAFFVESAGDLNRPEVHLNTQGLARRTYTVQLDLLPAGSLGRPTGTVLHTETTTVSVLPAPVANTVTPVQLRRTAVDPTHDQSLWAVIRSSTDALSFNRYSDFIDALLCEDKAKEGPPLGDAPARLGQNRMSLPFVRVESYRLLKAATEVFMSVQVGVNIDPSTQRLAEESRRFGRPVGQNEIRALFDEYLTPVTPGSSISVLPYIDLIQNKLGDVPISSGHTDSITAACYTLLQEKLTNPCFIELIWCHWIELGMLVQTMNAISLRFQNVRNGDRDPLAEFEIDPLRPMNNLLWGYIQDEQHRLSLVRRAYEYEHHYGMTLAGRAVPKMRPAESRSKFLEAFNNLLQKCAAFMKEDDDTTIIADGFPVLNALKEVHMLLTQGMHNQYGDLPWTARHEMLMQQWLLGRPEMREFLPSRVMVAYPEKWMDRVEAMKRLQGWTDIPITHFRDLGVFGEQLLLGIRFGAWSTVNDPAQAANWVRYWRPEIQGYIHSYRAVTGIDVASETADTRQVEERSLPPAVHIARRAARASAQLRLGAPR